MRSSMPDSMNGDKGVPPFLSTATTCLNNLVCLDLRAIEPPIRPTPNIRIFFIRIMSLLDAEIVSR